MDILLKNYTSAWFFRAIPKALVHLNTKLSLYICCKKKYLFEICGSSKDSLFLILEHYKHILGKDLNATIASSATKGHFETLFVCIGIAKEVLKHCGPLVSFD